MKLNSALLFFFLFVLLGLESCSDAAPPVKEPHEIETHFGPFVFKHTDEWKSWPKADSLIFEKDSCRVAAAIGYNRTFTLFHDVPPAKLPPLTVDERQMLENYFPQPYYPDSLPAKLGKLRFRVSNDDELRRYACFSDTTGFASELLIAHTGGTSIHFETTSGLTSAEELFELIFESIRFAPDGTVPVLLGFSVQDSVIDCCSRNLPDGKENPYYQKTLMRENDDIIEYWTSERFDNTYATTLHHSMRIKYDTIFLSAVQGMWDLEYFDGPGTGMIASPPHMMRLTCDCWTCETVYFRVQVPKGKKYKVVFEQETISVGEPVMLK